MYLLGTYGKFARILIGLIFLFSGISKGVDTPSTSLMLYGMFTNYISFLPFYAYDIVSFALVALELITGMCLLIGLFRKFVTRFCLLLVSFFTVFTFINAIGRFSDDCGCFGGILHFTRWQSFAKNILILALSIISLYDKTEFRDVKRYYVVAIPVSAYCISLFCFMGILYQPI